MKQNIPRTQDTPQAQDTKHKRRVHEDALGSPGVIHNFSIEKFPYFGTCVPEKYYV